jgi:predicted RNase H-like HicB family nuclease
MSDYHINIFYSEEDGGYIADIPDMESCSAFGETPERALAELEGAKAAWIEAAKAEGKEVPPPPVPPRHIPGGAAVGRSSVSGA